MITREAFHGRDIAANATTVITGTYIGAFLAKTAGTITVTSFQPDGTTAVTLVNAVPIAAGSYTPLPLRVEHNVGFTVVLAGGASGTLFV